MMQHTFLSIRQALCSCYSPSEASAIARLVLEKRFGVSMTDIYMGKDSYFSLEQERELDDILRRLKAFESVQYVLGEADFDGLTFRVNADVLIPRPETAELVEWVAQEALSGRNVLDIGTGSGCIAIALSKRFPEACVEAWDISSGALEVARENNRLNGTSVHFVQRDVLAPLTGPAGPFDVVVSNPPYVTLSEKSGMEPNVLGWEPDSALFVPDEDPLRYYRRIALLGRELLRPSGMLFLEINRAYGPETVELLRRTGYKEVILRKDLSGNDRMIKASYEGDN